MANSNPGYCLFRDSQGFDISRLPEPYRGWHKTSTDPAVMSIHNRQKNKTTLHRYTTQALLEYADEAGCNMGVVKIADGSYASEWLQSDGTSIIAHATKNGVLSAGRRDALTGKMSQLPSIGSSSTEFNDSSILLLYLLIEADINASKGITGTNSNTITHELLQACRDEFAANGVLPEEWVRLVCDDLYFAVSYGEIPVNIRNGNIGLLTDRRLASNEFSTGKVICGHPDTLIGKQADSTSNTNSGRSSVREAKAVAKPYTDTLSWSEEEKMMIPHFDDDVEVPPEVMTILNRFLASREWKNPLNNPCWRGITAYGKSTGVKMLACILNTPLLWMTCATTTEVEDFLSKHVPNTEESHNVQADLPSFDDMANDPEYAYEQITGEYRENVTSDEVLQAYANLNWNNRVIWYFPTPEQRFVAFMGLFFHEKAHDLFCDFNEELRAMSYLNQGIIYGEIPSGLSAEEDRDWAEIETALSTPEARSIFVQVFKELSNIVDDVHDENSLIDIYGSFVAEGIYLCQNALHASCPLFEDMCVQLLTGNQSDLSIAYNLLLQTMRFGDVLCRDDSSLVNSRYGAMLEKVRTHAEIACATDDKMRQFSELNYIMLAIWPFIRTELQNQQQHGQQNQQGSAAGQSNSQTQDPGNSQGQAPNAGQNQTESLTSDQIQQILDQLSQGAAQAGQTRAPETRCRYPTLSAMSVEKTSFSICVMPWYSHILTIMP